MASFDFSPYKWRRDDSSPTLFKRQIGGGELINDFWNTHNHGELSLFLGIYTKLSQPFAPSSLLALARKAWISTRWDTPTIAAQILHEPREGSHLPVSLLTYTLPSGAADVEAWSEQTVFLKEGFKDLDELRYKVGPGLIPTKDFEPMIFLYVVPFSSTEFGFLIHASHVPYDGSGIKIIGTNFLEHLSKYITDSDYANNETSRIKWAMEWDRLLPNISQILRTHEPAEYDAEGSITKEEVPDEPRDGPKYLETLNEVITDIMKGGLVAHPFRSLITPPYDPSNTAPSTRRASYTFTPEDSEKLVNIRSKGLTVNQAAQGALSLLPIMDNPPPPGSSNVVFYSGPVNARGRLAKEYRGTYDYPGYCLAVSPIQIPVSIIDKYQGDIENNLKDIVIEFAHKVKEDYQRQAKYPSFLAIVNQEIDLFLSGPPPPPWRGPWFSGDGRGAIYLRPSYPQSGEDVIEITDFFFGINKTDPGPFFRITEWNWRIKLSADYNELAVEPSVVDGWMKKWAELLLIAAS